ncbi:MAG: cation:proton antiporter, partial [Chloroflexota bacterium]
ISIGSVATWVLATAAAYYILAFSLPLSLLLGAILVVTGPTVIIPLLRHIRPVGKAGYATKWEGIVNDPIGAVLAVLVFEAILAGGFEAAREVVLLGLLRTLLIGSVLGIGGAALIVFLMWRYLIPDFLQNAVTLMVVIGTFALSNILQHESGLLTVTLLGIVLANQSYVNIKHIIEFKENLRVLLISALFILLAARIQPSDLALIGPRSLLFLVALILIVRPISVYLSMLGTSLDWRERLFVAWLAPRGIVAAAVASLFALELTAAGFAEAERLVPVMFVVIVGTVTIYGLTIGPLARWLNISDDDPQGILIAGAHDWARQIATVLQNEGFRVLLADTNWRNLRQAKADELPTFQGSITSEYAADEMDLSGIGRLFAITSNDEVNALASLHFAEIFGRSEVYQLTDGKRAGDPNELVPVHVGGRRLFGLEITTDYLEERFDNGAVIKTTKLTAEFGFDDFKTLYGESAIPLFAIDESDKLVVATVSNPLSPRVGQTLVALVDPVGPIHLPDDVTERPQNKGIGETNVPKKSGRIDGFILNALLPKFKL